MRSLPLEPCPPRRCRRGRADPGKRPPAAGREHPAGGAGRAGLRGQRPARAGAASGEPDRRADDARRIRLVRRRAYGGGPVAALHRRLRRGGPDRRTVRAPRPRLPVGTARDQDRTPRDGGHVRLRARASARVAALRRPARPEMRRVPRERVPGGPNDTLAVVLGLPTLVFVLGILVAVVVILVRRWRAATRHYGACSRPCT